MNWFSSKKSLNIKISNCVHTFTKKATKEDLVSFIIISYSQTHPHQHQKPGPKTNQHKKHLHINQKIYRNDNVVTNIQHATIQHKYMQQYTTNKQWKYWWWWWFSKDAKTDVIFNELHLDMHVWISQKKKKKLYKNKTFVILYMTILLLLLMMMMMILNAGIEWFWFFFFWELPSWLG